MSDMKSELVEFRDVCEGVGLANFKTILRPTVIAVPCNRAGRCGVFKPICSWNRSGCRLVVTSLLYGKSKGFAVKF